MTTVLAALDGNVADMGKAIAFGVFASKGDADAFGATEAFRAADARLASALLAAPVREEYEVYTR